MHRRIQHVHFVGVGGIGMCGLAELLHEQGYRVSGSDLLEGKTIDRLRSLGIDVVIGHDASNVGDCDVVVVSSAIRATNPELQHAAARKIPVIARAEMLAELMRLKNGIAVGGSHGKTTTTSLIAHVLGAAGLDPTSVIGGRVLGGAGDPSGARLGRGDLLIAEADESDGSFLHLAPVIAVVTNVDPEHLDHYGTFEAVQDAFVHFANRIPFWGLAVVCIDHPGVQAIRPRLERRVATYGESPQADWAARDVVSTGGGSRFEVVRRGEVLGSLQLPLPGRHNVHNALAALVVADELEVPFGVAADALASFGGIERRFESKGRRGGIEIVDDYAHHPAEIRATLAAARDTGPARIVAVFQPHRYTRTRDCFEDLTTAFNDADVVVVTGIYAAGEDKIPGIDAAHLVEAIRAHGHRDARHIADLAAVEERLPADLQRGDLVLTLGAGDIGGLGARLVARLDEKERA